VHTIKKLLSNISSSNRINSSDRDHVPLLPRPRVPFLTLPQSPLPRLSISHSNNYDKLYNLSLNARCNLMSKNPTVSSLNSNPLQIINEGRPSIYNYITSEKVLNRSKNLSISPERGLLRVCRKDSARIREIGRSQSSTILSNPHSPSLSISVSPRLDRSLSPSTFLDVQPIIRRLACILMVAAIKLNMDPGELMTSVNNVLVNLPFESVKQAINSGVFDMPGSAEELSRSAAETLSNIIEGSSSSSMQDSARSADIQPIPIDLDQASSSHDESTGVDRQNNYNVLKLLIGASLLVATFAAAAKGFS
jgi:hypothetical protein